MGVTFAETGLKSLCKVDGETYRRWKIREVRRRNGLATLGFVLFVSVIAKVTLIVAVNGSARLLAKMFYGVMFIIGVGTYIFLWINAEKNVKSKKLDAVYKGMAQVIVAYPLTVQYFDVDGNVIMKQVDLQGQRILSVGTFVKIVTEDDEIVKVIE